MAFYGICVIAMSWLVLTVIMENHFGMPGTPMQWAKRMIGWGVELWLIRSLVVGIRRSRAAIAP